MLSATSRILAEEFLRLTTLLGRAVAPEDLIAAIRDDPEHPLRPAFRNLPSDRAWAARLAWLVDRLRLEQGLPTPVEDQELVTGLHDRQQRRKKASQPDPSN